MNHGEATVSNRKDKQAQRVARKRKAQRRQALSAQEALFKRVQSSEYFKNVEVVRGVGITEKMSDVILRFAEPLQDEDGDLGANQVRLAIMIWNASLLPEETQAEALQEIQEIIPRHHREARREMLELIDELLERKETHFSENKRIIIDYDIRDTARGLHLNVVSTPPQDDNAG